MDQDVRSHGGANMTDPQEQSECELGLLQGAHRRRGAHCQEWRVEGQK